MCYSAMVKANLKALGIKYDARVQEDAFDELFEGRIKGSGAKIPRVFEAYFKSENSQKSKQVLALIDKWNHSLQLDLESKIEEQSIRLENAISKLKLKETKAALNDKRIAREKIEKFKEKLSELRSDEVEEATRIFPHSYAPLIVMEKGERVIKPYRYHLRPRGESESFDRKYDGTYNVRRDRLKDVIWWRNIYGKNHGILIISKFYENVKKHDFEGRTLAKGESEENSVVEFTPNTNGELLVPCLFDRNEEGSVPLNSFALITDEPNPEVSAVGHDRTPIFLKLSNIDSWLKTEGSEPSKFDEVLKDKEQTCFIPRLQTRT